MAVAARAELVGRRFLCASGGESLELGGVSRWGWRAGVIRAVTTRDSPAVSVCVEWSGESAAELHWRRLQEEWEVFMLEQELVWAKRSNSQEDNTPQIGLLFRPLIGQAWVGGVSVVEFLSDRQLEFYTDREELRPYEGDVVSGSAVLSADPSGWEQLQAWNTQHQLQHILQLGHSGVKGLRVKVFQHDSKPQWLHGVVSHHDHDTRIITVLIDQRAEPLSVDPTLTHVLSLDHVSHTPQTGENSTAKRKAHSNKISRMTLNTVNKSSNTTASDQACSSGPGQRKLSQLCRQNRQTRGPVEGEASGVGEKASPTEAPAGPAERKRRKAGEEDEEEEEEEEREEEQRDKKETRRVGLKRPKGGLDLSHSSEEEEEEEGVESGGSRGRGLPCTAPSKSLVKKRCASKRRHDGETAHNPSGLAARETNTQPSPASRDLSSSQSADGEGQQEVGNPPPQVQVSVVPCDGALLNSGLARCTEDLGCDKVEEVRRDGGMETEDRGEGASREDSEAVSALLASQENEQLVSMETACVLLHTSPPECEAAEGDQEIPPGDPEVRGSEFNHPEVTAPSCDSAVSVEEEPSGATAHSPGPPCNAEVDAGKASPAAASPVHEAPPVSEASHKAAVLPPPRPSSPEGVSRPTADASRRQRNVSPKATVRDRGSPGHGTTDRSHRDFKTTPAPKVPRVPTPNRPTSASPTPTSTDPEPPHGSVTPPQSLFRKLNGAPTPDKPTKSPLIIDRNEPFTVYRDPALVRKELENVPTYIHPPHTPPNPHAKHHLKCPSPSSSGPGLAPNSAHNKILSPAAHLSPLPLPSQSPLCSSHPSIPHPHLLPSLLPGLPPSTALLAAHPRLGPLGLPHHPLALQAAPSLLGQSPGTTPLAPLGLYPLLWPTFPNGAHSYSLGLQGSKWPPPESVSISETSLRGNTPSPWLPQPTPVTSAEGQRLRPPMPVCSSSSETRANRSVQPTTPSCKATEEVERRVFTETPGAAHTALKAEPERVRVGVAKNGHAYRPVAPESPSNRPKQSAMVYEVTGDCSSHYQEESRRTLQESVKMAPFTAKLGSDREPRYPKSSPASLQSREREREHEREREREREREMHVFRHCLPPRPQSAHPSPTLTQSSYYTPTGGGGENKPSGRRAPPNKELYERLSGSSTAPSVLHASGAQGAVKAKPPPLVKRHPEKEEGLLGKIAEQLACKAVCVEPAELGNVERKGSCASLISVSTSSSRAVHSLHRAPIFHPPAPPIMASKEVGQGRLSPPTLTPIQPMSIAGKVQNQQRPPTLMPELRHGAVAGRRPVPEPVTVTSQAYDSQRSGALQSREPMTGGNVVNGGVVTPQSATASVIVQPSSYMHMALSYTVDDRCASRARCDHVRTCESVPNAHTKEGGVQYKRGVLWTPVDTVHPVNMATSKQDVNTPLNMTTRNTGPSPFPNHGVKYSVNIDTPHTRIDLLSERCKKEEIGPVQPKAALSFSTCCPPRDLPHVKKRRAGLAAPEPRHNMHTVQPLHTTHAFNATKSALHTSYSRYGTYTTHSTHTVCTAHTIDREKESVFNPSPPKCPRLAPDVVGIGGEFKPSSLATDQPVAPVPHTNQPAQSGQNNYHKLKKAWLTRHSEQDRGSVTSQAAGGSQTDATLNASANISLPTKPEANGLDDKFANQEGKKSCLDNRKSKTLDRKCPPEDRKSNGTDTKSNTEDMKPVLVDNKASLEDIKLILEPSSQNKKLCANERKPSPVNFKTGKEEKWDFKPSFKLESGDDSGNESESCKPLAKRQPKPPLAKKKEGDELEEEDGEEEEGQPNGTLRTAKEKSQHRMSNSNGIPRSVLKDWRKVKKLKQSGEAFLQDDSCAEIGANVQKCRECRLDRSRKAQEPAISPVFCRFYYFRRLSYSKNGVVRVDGFSVAEESDEEAVRVWMSGFEDEGSEERKEMEPDTAKYVLTLTGDKFCQLVKTENIASTWIKKDTQLMWKRAVRGVREMCDACEATLFNMHWACHKCGFVVCMDCYKGRERKSTRDKELYAWVRCVKNQPHDLKNLMPTQIVPEQVLEGLQSSMHSVRREYGIPAHCSCPGSNTLPHKLITTNGLSQLSQRTQCDPQRPRGSPQVPDQQKSAQDTANRTTPAERHAKLECDGMEAVVRKPSSPEQGSTLRDLLTSTAGKLRMGSTGPGMAFAPVYSTASQTAQNTRMPNLLDDIIASVVENKIPASKMATLGVKQDLLAEEKVGPAMEEAKPDQILLADPHANVPHDWIGSHRLLWLKDHRHLGNQRLFKENWTQEQPVLVSGLHRSLTPGLWMPELFCRDFSGLHGDLYNCRDGSITNTRVKEFWDGFEDVSKRPKTGKGDPAVYRLKDWPSGEEFLALMPSRYEDVMRTLPVPEYTGPNGTFNLASRLPSFFIRPDLGPRLCCAHGVTACPEQDFGTSNLHVEISDTMSILVYVGLAKGNGALSKSGVLKLLESEALDESVRGRLRDPAEVPGALWHIFLSKDLQKIQDFLQTVSAEHTEVDTEGDGEAEAEMDSEADPLREGSWYLSPELRRRLLEEQGVESRTLLQFHGDAVIIPAGAVHQVMNLHSCIQVNVDFVSPEHAHNSYYLTQELRPLKDQVNYEDKLQVKNIFYHSVKDAVATLSRHLKEQSTKEVKEEES